MLVIQNIISKKNTNHQDNLAPIIINNISSIEVQQVIRCFIAANIRLISTKQSFIANWVKNMIDMYDKVCSIYK